MKSLTNLAYATLGMALALPACATSRPENSNDCAWIEARRVLNEYKAAEGITVAVVIPKRLEIAPASVPLVATKFAAPSSLPSRDRFHPTRTTAYFHGEADHLVYGRKSAMGSDLTYGDQRSAAADWSRYPLGTRFRIVGDSYDCEYRIDDYGKALVGTNTIDLYKPTRGAMNAWGCRQVVIEIIEWGSYENSLRVMADRTRAPHVRRMVEAIRARPPEGGRSEGKIAAVTPSQPSHGNGEFE